MPVVQTLFLRSSLSYGFDHDGRIQVVPVLEGSKVSINDTLLRPFDHSRGGAFIVLADTVVLKGTVDVSGCGYVGGRASLSGHDTSVTETESDLLDAVSGQKGFSWRMLRGALLAGRGTNHTGGGGGNALNAGGGGGAHYGSGGRGGDQTSASLRFGNGGEGGEAHSTSESSTLIFGGGGGGGHQNDFLASEGAAGGGVVFIKARVLIAEDAYINVNGADAESSLNDGAGGGGGGGTIVVDVDTLIGSLTLSASGGKGGDAYGLFHCYGPGGGGGGGSIVLDVDNDLGAVRANVSGGDAGRSLGEGPCLTDTAYGARGGEPGIVFRDATYPSWDRPKPCAEPVLIVRGRDTTARVGEYIGVPLQVISEQPLLQRATLHLQVRTRATVLYPLSAFFWAGTYETISFVRFPLEQGFVGSLDKYVSYQALLGDSMAVHVRIDTAYTEPPLDVMVERHGEFILNDVCTTQQQPRLFDAFGAMRQRVRSFNTNGQSVQDKPGDRPVLMKQLVLPDGTVIELIP